jgi:hypothetical protein
MDPKIISCYLPVVNKQTIWGEQEYILRQGIINNNRTKLASSENEADLILLDLRNFFPEHKYNIIYPEKTIIVDYRDDFDKFFKQPCLLYFKRSFINLKNEIVKSSFNYIPIQYALRMCYVEESKKKHKIEQDIDISVLFHTNSSKEHNKSRTKVLNFIKNHPKLTRFNKQVGLVSSGDEKGRSEYNETYWDTLSRSKIVVTCNPTNWEGDQRFTEATGSNSLVFQDVMYSNYKNLFVHEEHCIFYELDNLEKLVDQIVFYLQPENEKKRKIIAENAYDHTMKYHTVKHRIDEILDEYNSKLTGHNI